MLKDGFISFVKGIIIGLSSLVSGISCGSVFFSLDIYEKFIYSVNKIFKKPNRKFYLIVIPSLLGLLAAILGGRDLIEYFISNYEAQTIFLFIGIMAGGYRLLLRDSDIKYKTSNFIWFLFVFVLLLVMYYFLYDKVLFTISNNFISSIVLGLAFGFIMFLPGFSLILDSTLMGFHLNSFGFILLFILFVLIGLYLFCKIFYVFMKKYNEKAKVLIVALILCSIVIAILHIDNFIFNFVNVFTTILTFLWGYIFIKNVVKE